MEDWYSSSLQKELCSPASAEGWDLVFADYILCFLSYVTHRYIDTFSIGPVVGAQEVM